MDYCYFNGEIIPMGDARLALNDLGVLRGYGVFDYLRTYDGKPFHIEKNLKRFRNSADKLGLTIPYSDEQITTAVLALIQKNKYPQSSIRIVLTGGVSEDALTPSKPTFYILVTQLHPLPSSYYEDGVKLITHEYLRLVPEAKTLNYLTAVRLLPQRTAAKALEVLYIYQGKVLECSTSNFYIFKGDTLITPHIDVLSGVTRSILLELAKKEFKVEERDLLVSEIAEADEAFISAANKMVLPVRQVDETVIGDGKVGSKTQILMEKFRGYVSEHS